MAGIPELPHQPCHLHRLQRRIQAGFPKAHQIQTVLLKRRQAWIKTGISSEKKWSEKGKTKTIDNSQSGTTVQKMYHVDKCDFFKNTLNICA